MLILRQINQDLIAYQKGDDESVLLGHDVIEQTLLSSNQESILILDYETYFNPSLRCQIFDEYPFLQKVTIMCSPHEAIGGYVQSFNPEYEGDIKVIDFESGHLYSYTIAFPERRYFCKNKAADGKKTQLAQLAKNNLNLSGAQLLNFEKFLGLEAMDGKCYGQIIKEALTEYEKGSTEYDDILAVLDITEWAHIKMGDLIAFKEQVLKACKANPSKLLMMTGWLGYLFTIKEAIPYGMEKIYGAIHLLKNRYQFYSKAQTDIALGIYCYPNWIKLPVYKAQSDYETYCSPKSIELLDSGSVTLYRGEEYLTIKTNSKSGRIKLEINLDGNQNLLLVAGEETYLLA
ncbi:MAG: hypothetical protein CV087_19725 [Candidatus Brocadia sp. WS118]|nr:MAG: hypothetical protein CV087_19725 [Candidatus Brocadia sp. WS118]